MDSIVVQCRTCKTVLESHSDTGTVVCRCGAIRIHDGTAQIMRGKNIYGDLIEMEVVDDEYS